MKKILKGDSLSGQISLADKVRGGGKSIHSSNLGHTGGILNRKTLEAGEKATSIIGEAEAVAERVRQDAAKILDEVEGAREKAKKEGFVEGREEGLAQATELIIRFETLKESFYEKAEPEIIALVMEIAEKVIGRMVQDHREAIVSIVRQAVESALGDRLTIRLNPEDFRKVQPKIKELQEGVDKTRRLVFKEDDSISAGGCVVETEVGMIDAQLETQLRAIRKAFEI